MLKTIKVSELKDHPENKYYFDDMEGGKWEDFLESIQDRGVIEAPIVTEDLVIVGGHQRIRACRELGIAEVECEVRHYDTDAAVLRDLIEMNIQQRGEITCSRIKKARIIKAMDEVYGVRRGGDHGNQYAEVNKNATLPKLRITTLANETEDGSRAQTTSSASGANVVRDKMHLSKGEYFAIKKLNALIPELQEAVDEDKLPFTIASRVISTLSEEEQNQLAAMLPKDSKMSIRETQEYIDMVKQKDAEISQLESAKIEAEKKAEVMTQEAVDAVKAIKNSNNSEEYLKVVKQLEAQKDETRKEYERSQKLRQQILDNNKKSADAIRDLENRLATAEKKAETVPETIYPDDYEAIKSELEALKNGNGNFEVQTSDHAVMDSVRIIQVELDSLAARLGSDAAITYDCYDEMYEKMSNVVSVARDILNIAMENVKKVEVA